MQSTWYWGKDMKLPALCLPIFCQEHGSNTPEMHPIYVCTSKSRISLALLTESEPYGEQQLGVMTAGCRIKNARSWGQLWDPAENRFRYALICHHARKFTLKSQSHAVFSQFSLKWEKAVSQYGWGNSWHHDCSLIWVWSRLAFINFSHLV